MQWKQKYSSITVRCQSHASGWTVKTASFSKYIIPVFLGIVLRLARLGGQYLWYDEAFSAMMSSLPVHRLLEATAGDVHPPLWYLIERGFILLLGNSEFVLRLPAALLSIVALLLVAPLCKAISTTPTPPPLAGEGSRVGAVATWLFALSPFQIAYAQEARMYALLLVAVELATIGAFTSRWPLYVLGATLALYSHNIGIVYVGCLALVTVWIRRHVLQEHLLSPILYTGLAGMLYAPWAWVTISQALDVAGSFWVQRPTWGAPALVLHRLFWGNAPLPSMGVPAALLSGLGVCAVVYVFVQRRAWRLLWLSFAPLAASFAVSLFSPVLVARTMIGCTPFLTIGLAQVLSTRRGKWLAVAGAPVLLAVLFGYYVLPDAQKGDIAPIIQPVVAAYRPGDAVFHTSVASYILLSYYLPDCEHVLWRQANDLSQSLTDRTKTAMGMTQVESIDDLLTSYHRVWGYWSDSPVTSQAESDYVAYVRARYPLELDHLFPTDEYGLIESGVYLVTNGAVWLDKSVTKKGD